MNVVHGMNRADLDRCLRSLGGQVKFLRRTGDVQYSHPTLQERPRANGRRKDAPRSLTAFVLRVIRAVSDSRISGATVFANMPKEPSHA